MSDQEDNIIKEDASQQVEEKIWKKFGAELMGTFMLVLIGLGVNMQTFFSKEEGGNVITGGFGWGFGLFCGILCSMKVSGAHLNPAVSLSQLIYGKLTIKLFCGYVVSQLIGGFLGAMFVYASYRENLILDTNNQFTVSPHENATAGLFSVYPKSYLGYFTPYINEFIGTFILITVITAMGDNKNYPETQSEGWGEEGPVREQFVPLTLALTLTAIEITFSFNTGAAVNPARDLGPRIATWCLGYGDEVFTTHEFCFLVPIIAPFAAGILAPFIYSLFISNHHDREEEEDTELQNLRSQDGSDGGEDQNNNNNQNNKN